MRRIKNLSGKDVVILVVGGTIFLYFLFGLDLEQKVRLGVVALCTGVAAFIMILILALLSRRLR
jgi:hypothetical protein